MHSSTSSSGLLLQAVVSRCGRGSSVAFLKQTLHAVEHAHVQHDGKLLLFLARYNNTC